MRYTAEIFEDFLRNVDLKKYRDKYSHIKTVEMDLPRNIQALDMLYDIYWNENKQQDNAKDKKPPMFDAFYKAYFDKYKNNIDIFGEKCGFGNTCDCFSKGLEARIYRTWASIITQIHAGYVAESVFGIGSVSQSTELDHRNIDMLVNYEGVEIKIQIKKESKRPEISRMYGKTNENTVENIYSIWYVVPKENDYNDPYYRIGKNKGDLRAALKTFKKFAGEDATLDRLDNGFVIFTKKEFDMIKEQIDSLRQQ